MSVPRFCVLAFLGTLYAAALLQVPPLCRLAVWNVPCLSKPIFTPSISLDISGQREFSKLLQKPSWDEKSSNPYFKMNIPDIYSIEYTAYIERSILEFTWPRPRRISNKWFHILITTTTLNMLSRHIRNILLLFDHCKISLCTKFPGSCFSLPRDRKGSICMKFHDCNYLILRSLLVFYILTNTGECWIY